MGSARSVATAIAAVFATTAFAATCASMVSFACFPATAFAEATAAAADPASPVSPADLVTRSVAAHRLPDEIEERTMRIVSASGDAKERQITVWSMTTPAGRAKTLARFTSPKDVEGTAILTWEADAGQSGDQWFFLPALHKAKRVASGGKKTRFMGTDFSYEDLSPEDPAAWTYTSAGEADVDGAPCWIVEAVPASSSVDTSYAKRRLSIRKDNLYIVRRELFDASGKLAKVQSDRKLVEVSAPAWRADEITMEDKVAGTSTVLAIRKREHSKGLKEDLFTTAALEAGDDF
jgi:uncharacterized protein